MDDPEVILNFERVDKEYLTSGDSCGVAALSPGTQTSSAHFKGMGTAAGDCGPLTTSCLSKRKTNDNLASNVFDARAQNLSDSHVQSSMFDQGMTQNHILSSHKSSKPIVMPDHFNGSIPWTDYMAHFETCAEVNNWNDIDKSRFLTVSLRGSAQQVMGDLTPDERRNYKVLVDAIGRRFNPERQTELHRAQLRSRTRKPNESLPELGQAIKRLVKLAYPRASCELVDSLGRDYLLDALSDPNLRLHVYQARPSTIDQAVCVAIEFEAFQKAENQRSGGKRPMRMVSSSHDKNGYDDCGRQGQDGNSDDLTKSLSELIAQQKLSNREQARHNRRIENDMMKLSDRVSDLERKQNSADYRNVRDLHSHSQASKHDRSVTCYSCREKGHISSNCPKSSKRNKQQNNAEN